jgi:hypothetical protein
MFGQVFFAATCHVLRLDENLSHNQTHNIAEKRNCGFWANTKIAKLNLSLEVKLP